MKTKQECPKLAALADNCWTGACNRYALINALSDAIKAELSPGEMDHVTIPIIVTQIASLSGQGIGPSPEALDAWLNWVHEDDLETTTPIADR